MSRSADQATVFEVACVATHWLMQGNAVSMRWLMARFGVSRATATRYMHRLEVSLPVVRGRELGSRTTALRMMDEGPRA